MKELNKEQKNKVAEIIANYVECDPNDIEENDNFKTDLGVDSLELIEIMIDIEEHFNVHIPDYEIEDVETVEELYNIVAIFTSEKYPLNTIIIE